MLDGQALKDFENNLKQIADDLQRLNVSHPSWINAELKNGMINIRNEIIQSMRDTPKTGKVYKRPGGKTHIASSHPNPPAIDYGELARSISFDVRDNEAEIGAVAQHGLYMEEGTKKVEKRPFLETERIDKEINQLVNRIGEVSVEIIARPFGRAVSRSTRHFSG